MALTPVFLGDRSAFSCNSDLSKRSRIFVGVRTITHPTLSESSQVHARNTLNTAMLPESTPILIVGAGPTGLACAISLVTNGVRPQDITIVDAQAQGLNWSRALVIHAKTLEELDTVDCADMLADRGTHSSHVSIRSKSTVLLKANFESLASRTRFPFALLVSQADTEHYLEERLKHLGVIVRRPHRLVNIEGADEGVRATFEGGEVVKVRYLVGADGSRSTVRRLAGIPFKDPVTGKDPHSEETRGEVSTERPVNVAVADVHLSGDIPVSTDGNLFFGRLGMLLFVQLPPPLNGTDLRSVYRLAFPVQPGTKDVTKKVLMEYLRVGLGRPEAELPTIDSIIFSSTFRIRFAVADRFSQSIGGGEIALVGDAAHIHAPIGGQGMNLGIRDAIQLGRVLTNILVVDASDDKPSTKKAYSAHALERYSDDRRPLALEVIRMTKLLTWIAALEGGVAQLVRNTLLWVLGSMPWVRNMMALRLSGL
ncbi:unnamed protein product [Somion occarium]|uniref:FAD-binding domain-containing protein n=1 Tax=Somion occarium TaxID=3059160 RepID=A0ABP1E884_9APHY